MSDHPAVAYLRNAHVHAEQLTKAATPGPWTVDSETYAESIRAADGTDVVAGGRWGGEASVFESTQDALHIAAQSPGLVLRRIEAERELLAEHAPDDLRFPECLRCGGNTVDVELGGGRILRHKEPVDWPCQTIRLLARGWGWTEEAP